MSALGDPGEHTWPGVLRVESSAPKASAVAAAGTLERRLKGQQNLKARVWGVRCPPLLMWMLPSARV